MQTRIPLDIRRLARLLGLFGSAILVPATLMCVTLGVVVAALDIHRLVKVLLVAAAIVATVFVGKLAWMALRLWRVREAAITLTDSEMIVEHRGLFSRPLVVPKQSVAAATVVGSMDREHLEVLGRFLLEGVRDAVPEDLRGIRSPRELIGLRPLRSVFAAFREGVSVPILSLLPDIPNVAIRLRSPVEMSTAWPGPGLAYRYTGFRPPQRGEKVRGLVARADDPEAARRAFEAWGVLEAVPESPLA